MDIVRQLVREEIAKLLQDDALFGSHDDNAVLSDFDVPGNLGGHKDMPLSCPICGTEHEGPCHKPGHKRDKRSYMARPQLYGIAKDTSEIFNMINKGQQIDDWMESYIAQASQMLDAVNSELSYKRSALHEPDAELGIHSLGDE